VTDDKQATFLEQSWTVTATRIVAPLHAGHAAFLLVLN